MILSGSLSNLGGTLEETKCLMLNLGASDEVDKWLWLRLAAILSYPGARLALQVGTVCTGWGEAAKLGRRQERLKRGKWLFLSRNPHSFAKLKFSSLLAALLFPLSLFHYSGSSAFTLSTKGLSLLHSISALCHPFPPPPAPVDPYGGFAIGLFKLTEEQGSQQTNSPDGSNCASAPTGFT